MSAIERDLNVVRGIGWDGISPEPRLWITEKTKEVAAGLLTKGGVSVKDPLVAISVNASRLSKRWPLENYVKLVGSSSEEDQRRYREGFVRDVKDHLREMERRDYLAQSDRTVDYILLFIDRKSTRLNSSH